MPEQRVLEQQRLWQALTPAEQQEMKSRLLSANGAKGPQPAKAKPAGQFDLIGYVRCELGKSDREPFRAWQHERTDAELFDMLVKLVDSGYMLKAGIGKESHQATLSDCDAPTECNGYVLSAFAGEARDAIALLLYKHHILLEGDWSNALSGSGKSVLR